MVGSGPRGEHAGIARERRSDDAPAYLIQRTARLLRLVFLQVVDTPATGVTPEQWRVLSVLLARDGLAQNRIADALFRDPPNTSRLLSGLERRGLVRRAADPEDRRRVRVHLTEAGRSLVSRTTPGAVAVRDRLYEGIDRADLETLRRTIRRVEENALALLAELEERTDGGAAGPDEEAAART